MNVEAYRARDRADASDDQAGGTKNLRSSSEYPWRVQGACAQSSIDVNEGI